MTTRDGGKPVTRDVNNYSPPQGPKNINDPKSPGLHGTNFGNCQCMDDGRPRSSGSPGLGGDRMSNSPTQGRR